MQYLPQLVLTTPTQETVPHTVPTSTGLGPIYETVLELLGQAVSSTQVLEWVPHVVQAELSGNHMQCGITSGQSGIYTIQSSWAGSGL